jgi:hypothetical protein
MTRATHVHFALLLCSLLALSPLRSDAQIRGSELATLAQTIDGTRIVIDYSRPRARGRDPLFGTRAVQWGEVWTPGANYATTLEVSRNVKLNGHPVPKGKYSMWMVVRKGADWTVVLDPRVRLFHMAHPDSTAAQIRFAARPDTVPFTEVLTFSMPALRADGGTIVMDWERVRVPIDVQVEPSLVTTLSAADAVPYLGRYQWADVDSTGKSIREYVFTVTHEDGTLKGRYDPEEPYFKKFALIRIAPDWFVPGIYDRRGAIYEVLKPDLVYEFTRAGARATSIVMRDDADRVQARATRIP